MFGHGLAQYRQCLLFGGPQYHVNRRVRADSAEGRAELGQAT